jgi:hypothetical protein
MTESEVFESVTGSGSSDFALVVKILNKRGSWCLIGGLAVNCYVEPVYTLDADIVVAASDIDPIKSDLIAAGFHVESFPHSLNAHMKGSDLRIQFSLDPRYQSFLRGTRSADVLGHTIPIASLEALIQGKIWAWQDPNPRPTKRKKDELDLMRILEAHPETKAVMPLEIRNQVPE